MCKETNRHTEVALSILEINWVDLVGHSRRANFSFDILLREIAKTNIHPHIPGEIYHDCIGKREAQRKFGDGVVRLDLRCVWVPSDTHALNEALRNVNPVPLRVSNHVSI